MSRRLCTDSAPPRPPLSLRRRCWALRCAVGLGGSRSSRRLCTDGAAPPRPPPRPWSVSSHTKSRMLCPGNQLPAPGWLLLWPLCLTPTFPWTWLWGVSSRPHWPAGRQLPAVTARLHLSWPGSCRPACTCPASLPFSRLFPAVPTQVSLETWAPSPQPSSLAPSLPTSCPSAPSSGLRDEGPTLR